jgi:hypothetical protein
MATSPSFVSSVWSRLRFDAVAVAVDFGNYLLIWAGVFGAHLVKLLAATLNVDPDVISFVAFLEKWVWIASFGAYFWRVVLRLGRALKG